MRADKWFISNLDDTQRSIVASDIDRNIIVQGVAGSGKTNLAIHRAKQASLFSDSYAIVVYTRALQRMVATGMRALGLDDERIAYDWAWDNSGFHLNGNVFYKEEEPTTLYLVDNDVVRKFVMLDNCDSIIDATEQNRGKNVVGLHFDDYVNSEVYRTYGRRQSFFVEEPFSGELDLAKCKSLSSAVLYKKAEEKVDYLIIDEVQDFSIAAIRNDYISKVNRTFALFGDSAQMIYKDQGSSMDDICAEFHGDPYVLKFNYRLPKSIAKVAQDISETPVDLLTYNMKDRGNSDYPYYPKPLVTKYSDRKAELQGILDKIRNEDLDDVAILVPFESDVKEVYSFLSDNDIPSQVLFRTRDTVPFRTIDTVPFRTINTLDMVNTSMPCILTYHAAKGTEFDNVFVPFANLGAIPDRKAFYVACTRSSHSLYISYSEILTNYMSNVNKLYLELDGATRNADYPFYVDVL